MADKKLICEGNCVEDYGFHHGEVVPVIVSGFHTKKPMRFNYCEQAINIDEGRGFIVTREIEEEETFPASPLPTPAPVAELPKEAEGKEVMDVLNRIVEMSQPGIPYYAYADNEAACAMASLLNDIGSEASAALVYLSHKSSTAINQI